MVIKRKATALESNLQRKKQKNTNYASDDEFSALRSLTLMSTSNTKEYWMIQVLQNIATSEFHFAFRSGEFGCSGEHCLNGPRAKSSCIQEFDAAFLLKTRMKYAPNASFHQSDYTSMTEDTLLPKGVWEYCDKDGLWRQMLQNHCKKLDEKWRAFLLNGSEGNTTLKTGSNSFLIDFFRMSRINIKSKDQCAIRRRVTPAKMKNRPNESNIAVINGGDCDVVLAFIDVAARKDHKIEMSLAFTGDEYFLRTVETNFSEPSQEAFHGPFSQSEGESIWNEKFEKLTGCSWVPDEEFKPVDGKYDIMKRPFNEILTQGKTKMKVEVDIRYHHGTLQQLREVAELGRWYLSNKPHSRRLVKWNDVVYCLDFENFRVTCPDDSGFYRPLTTVQKFEML